MWTYDSAYFIFKTIFFAIQIDEETSSHARMIISSTMQKLSLIRILWMYNNMISREIVLFTLVNTILIFVNVASEDEHSSCDTKRQGIW